jgi:hypothetical protein
MQTVDSGLQTYKTSFPVRHKNSIRLFRNINSVLRFFLSSYQYIDLIAGYPSSTHLLFFVCMVSSLKTQIPFQNTQLYIVEHAVFLFWSLLILGNEFISSLVEYNLLVCVSVSSLEFCFYFALILFRFSTPL